MAKSFVKDIAAEQSLTPFERAALSSRPFGSEEEASLSKAFTQALKAVGTARFASGEFEGMTFDQALAVRCYAWCLEHPDPSKLKDLMLIMGELRQADVSVTVSAVDSELAKRALGKAADGRDPS